MNPGSPTTTDGRSTPPSTTSPALIFALTLLLMLAFVARFHGVVVDDAYICLRYARNLTAGNGLVFNPGERVQGFTTFSWVMIAAGLTKVGINPEWGTRAVGLLSLVATLMAVVRFSPRDPRAQLAAWVAPLLVACSPPLAFYATAGLETVFFAALVTWSVCLAAQDTPGRAAVVSSALLGGAAALTRPEGAGVAVLVGLLTALPVRGESRERRRRAALWWAIVLAIVLPYIVWTTTYYGSPVPNTFYAKVGYGTAQVVRGMRYVRDYLADSGWLILLPLIGLCFAKPSRRLLVLAAVCACYTAYVVGVGGDGLVLYRFLVPVLPLTFLLIAEGTAAALDRAPGRLLRSAVVTLTLVSVGAPLLWAWRGTTLEAAQRARGEVDTWREVGRFFAANGRPSDTVAVIPAGAIPYYSGLRAIDMLGLNDPVIAHRRMGGLGLGHAGHEKYDVSHVLSKEPRFIVIGVYALARNPTDPARLVLPFYPAETELARSPDFQRDYGVRLARTPRGYFPYFERVDRAAR